MAKEELSSQISVLMVPFPAQGHLNQLLHLSRLLISSNSNKNIHIHYVSAPSHCQQAKLRLHGWNNFLSFPNLHFHQLSIPSFISPIPNSNSTTNFPSHLQPSFDATIHLREPIFTLMKSLSSTSQRVVVIHDFLMGSVVQDFVSLSNAESYSFAALSAFWILIHNWEMMGRTIPIDEEILDILPSMDDCFTHEFQQLLITNIDHLKSTSGHIYNSCRIVEGQFLDLLEKDVIADNKKQWALGPFNPVERIDEKNGIRQHKCLEWLDKQNENSVLYVSFGSSTSMSDEQIKEVAIGLEKSKQKFLWVLRDADKGDVFDNGEARTIQLPDGFEENVQEQGFVLRTWAPQLEILAHPATGGFMSHCGWNSCLESITMGVPIAAWAMHSDQPRNATLIAHVLKIGVVVRDWESRNQLVTSSMVEDAVRKLMVLEAERKRAAELGVAVRSLMEEDGATRRELDSFIAHISR